MCERELYRARPAGADGAFALSQWLPSAVLFHPPPKRPETSDSIRPRAGGGTELSSQLGQGWGLKEGDRFVAVTCCVLQARRFSHLVGMVILQKKWSKHLKMRTFHINSV